MTGRQVVSSLGRAAHLHENPSLHEPVAHSPLGRLDEAACSNADQDCENTQEDARADVDGRDRNVASFYEVERFLGECREGREAATESHHQSNAKPLRRTLAVYECGDDEADSETSSEVDRERRPRKDRFGVALDQCVDAVARGCTERSETSDGKEDGHARAPFVIGAISRRRRLKASPIALNRFYRGLHEAIVHAPLVLLQPEGVSLDGLERVHREDGHKREGDERWQSEPGDQQAPRVAVGCIRHGRDRGYNRESDRQKRRRAPRSEPAPRPLRRR